ncbi:MAG: hypothetical protein HHAS10_04030 [Candidatus Altimarinota bacterium]
MDTPEVILHADDTFSEATRASLYEYIEKDLHGKLDSYIKKHEKPNSPVRVELTVKHAKEKSFDGKLVLTVGNVQYRSEREGFRDLKDLVLHLFTHVKEQMAKQ